MELLHLNVDTGGQEAEQNSETEENWWQEADGELLEDDRLLLALVPWHLEHEEPSGEGGSDYQQNRCQVWVDLKLQKIFAGKCTAQLLTGAVLDLKLTAGLMGDT